MNTVGQIMEQVKLLTAEEKHELIVQLMDFGEDFSEKEIESAWLAEVERRREEVASGTARLISFAAIKNEFH